MTRSSSTARLVILASVLVTSILGWWSFRAVREFGSVMASVSAVRFEITSVSVDSAGSRLLVILAARNPSSRTLRVEELTFSLFSGTDFVVTNPDARAATAVPPQGSASLQYDLAVSDYYWQKVDPNGKKEWRLQGRALMLIDDIRPTFPVAINLRKEPSR